VGRSVRLVQTLGGTVQVDVVSGDQVVTDGPQAGKGRAAEATGALSAVGSRPRDVLVLKVGVEGNVALESLLADGAHEGEGLAAAVAVAARAVLLLLYLQHPKIMSSLSKLH
jgi:hypothetical protein